MDDATFEELDIVLVAIHSSFDLPRPAQTERVLRALSHPAVHIWAHPLARRLGKRDEIEIDAALVRALLQDQHADLADLHAHQ